METMGKSLLTLLGGSNLLLQLGAQNCELRCVVTWPQPAYQKPLICGTCDRRPRWKSTCKQITKKFIQKHAVPNTSGKGVLEQEKKSVPHVLDYCCCKQ